MSESEVDPNTGIDNQVAAKAVERTRPHIQAMLNAGHGGDIAAAALCEAFFGALKAAGLSGWQYEKASRKISASVGCAKQSGQSVQKAYAPLGQEISKMIEEGIDPLAIAYCMVGAIGNISKQLLGKSDQRATAITTTLLEQINLARTEPLRHNC